MSVKKSNFDDCTMLLKRMKAMVIIMTKGQNLCKENMRNINSEGIRYTVPVSL